MGKRRRKYKRKSEPGWYKDQKGKKYAVRVTVLSMLAMFLLTVAVPVIFWSGGGYNAMAGDTVVKSFRSAGDFDSYGLLSWGVASNLTRSYVTEVDVRGCSGVADGDWFYPAEQNETFSSHVIDCPDTACSDTNGHFLNYGFYQNVSVGKLLNADAAYLKVRVRFSMVGSFHLESRCYDGVACGFWVDSDSAGVRPDLFKAKQNELFELDGTNWTEVNYPFSRAELLQAESELGAGTKEKFIIALNLTNSSLSPSSMDGEVLDWELVFYSAGGGVKMMGELFGWSVGMMLMVCAAASTPYWNPTREKRRRSYRKTRRWYR